MVPRACFFVVGCKLHVLLYQLLRAVCSEVLSQNTITKAKSRDAQLCCSERRLLLSDQLCSRLIFGLLQCTKLIMNSYSSSTKYDYCPLKGSYKDMTQVAIQSNEGARSICCAPLRRAGWAEMPESPLRCSAR
jgi:hypothetical protein